MNRFSWGDPPRAAIVISEGKVKQDEILLPLLGGSPYVTILPWDRSWPLSPRILFWTAVHALRLRNLKAAYMIALLRVVDPAIVVTYIDNSLLFQRVVRAYPGPRYLSIQNGGRLVGRDHEGQRVFQGDFACFGAVDVEQYRSYGAEVARYHPVGSLKDAYYRAQYAGRPAAKRFDLCLVSQIKPFHEKVYPKTMQGLELQARHLRRFAESRGLTVSVAARRHPAAQADLFAWEKAWFHERLGPAAVVVPNLEAEYTAYRTMDESRVSLAMHTSMLREAFGRGGRVLSCNYSGDANYDFPLPGPWALSDPSYEAFEARLSSLLDMSEADYEKLSAAARSRAIGYDPADPTERYLSRLISDTVAARP